MPKIIDRQQFLDAVKSKYGSIQTISRQQILEVCEEYDLDRPRWLTKGDANRVGRGLYSLTGAPAPTTKAEKVKTVRKAAPVAAIQSEVPVADRAVQVEMALSLAHSSD